jgi:hypothetical protein
MKEAVKKVKLLKSAVVNEIRIERDHYFPNAYIIDLPLDLTPDHVWQDIFEREWRSSRQLWDRKLFLMGDKLRLITTSNDIEDKIDWVKQVIERTNENIDEYNEEMRKQVTPMDEHVRMQMLDEEARLERIRDVLRKRFDTL